MLPFNVADLASSLAPWNEQLIRFGFVFARVAGLLSVGPLLGRALLPWQARSGLAIVLSLLLAPLVTASGAKFDLIQVLCAGATEFGLGFLLGCASLLILWAIPLAGQLLDQQQAQPADEGGDFGGGSPLARWLCLWGAACFLLCAPTNGHVQAIVILADSFRAWPVGAPAALLDADLTVELLQQSSQLALQLIAPALAVMVLINFAIGLISASGLPGASNVLGTSTRPIVAALVLAASLPGIQQSISDCIRGLSRPSVRSLTNEPVRDR